MDTPPVKIGILLLQSKQYMSLDKDFINAIRLKVKDVVFITESIGIGADENLVIEKMQKMVLQENISIIAGFFGHRNIESVYDYAAANDILLIANDIGSTLPYTINKKRGVYINSFGLVETSYLLGKYLEEQNYRRVTIASSYYDSGYGIQGAIEQAFTTGDCKFSGHYIMPLHPRENEEEYMHQTISSSLPEAVFAFYSGIYAQENAAFLSTNNLTKSYPFYFTSFSINEKILEEHTTTFNNAYMVSSWTESMDNKENNDFIDLYKRTFFKNPNAFSLLGYETGLIIETLLQKTNALHDIDAMDTIMKNLPKGPRGEIKFHTDTQRTFFDNYIFKIASDNAPVTTLENNGMFILEIMNQQNPVNAGGWHNAYLCH